MLKRAALGLAATLGLTVGALAADEDKWSSYIDVEGKLGTDRNLGEVGLFVPLGQSHESLLFGNLITRMDDHDSFEGNVGLGYREIVDGSYILGGYAFYDRRRTSTDNFYNQITLGAEFLTDVWTVRGNAYLAEKDLHPTGGGVVSQTGTQIFVQSNMEGALSGFDAEVGRVIPLGLEDVTLTGFAGGFDFGRSGFDSVTGPRVRAELQFDDLWDGVLPAGSQLRMGAEFQHDDVRDGQGFLSARLRVPLFGGNGGSGLNALDRRMVDPVVRDIDVVAGAGLSAPVVPTLQGNPIQGARIIDGANDLGAELAAAGPRSIVIIDGSNGPITSTSGGAVQSGQMIVGAQRAQFQLVDPTTGQVIVWSPTPNGVRPTVQGVVLTLPSDGRILGMNFSSSLVLKPASSLVLTPGGGLSSNADIVDSTFSGNLFAVGPIVCNSIGSNILNGLNSTFPNNPGVASPIIARGGIIPPMNLFQLAQLNLQLVQAQQNKCLL